VYGWINFNSTEQGLFASQFGGASGSQLLASAPTNDPGSDVLTQVAKLTTAVLSGEYAEEQVRPQMFKGLIGRGHSEFCSGRQQDAVSVSLFHFIVLHFRFLFGEKHTHTHSDSSFFLSSFCLSK
jgi:uncharacterized UBP type Zn finger protein